MTEALGPCLQNVLLAMIIADEDIDPDEIAAAERAYDELVGEALPDGELARRAVQAQAEGRRPQDVLQCLPGDLSTRAREQVLGAAFRVASADGFVLEEEDALLGAVAKALGMNPTEARTVLNALMS